MKFSKKFVFVFFLLLFCLLLNPCFAQNAASTGDVTTGNGVHLRKTEFPPKALLVQLRSEQNRIKYLESHNSSDKAEKVKHDAAIIRDVMINDFRDHFSFCPVYYFIDTNADLIKQQKFDGTLFDADRKPVTKPVINPGDTDYYIVYYGYPENEKTELSVTRESTYKYGSGNVMGKGLVFLNYKYEQRDYYYVIHNFRDLIYRFLNHNYEFYSKKFDMEYRPLATKYNTDLFNEFKTGYTTNK